MLFRSVIDVARLVAGPPSVNGSLGLEQAVYAYGSSGNIHPAAYLASLRFFQELKDQNKLVAFSVVRNAFEDFLVKHKPFINALGHTKGSRTRPLEAILQMYRIVFAAVHRSEPESDIINQLQKDPTLSKAILSVVPVDGTEPIRRRFSAVAVKTKLVDEVLNTRPRCSICGARLPPSYRSKDHIEKKENEGMGNAENLRFTHPYCNHSRDSIEAARERNASQSQE